MQFKIWKCSQSMVWVSLYNEKISFKLQNTSHGWSYLKTTLQVQAEASSQASLEVLGLGSEAYMGVLAGSLRQNHWPLQLYLSFPSEQ